MDEAEGPIAAIIPLSNVVSERRTLTSVPVKFEGALVTVEVVKVVLVALKRKDACGKVGGNKSLVLTVASGSGVT